MTKDELITYATLHAETGLPMGTLYSLVAQKKIPHIRLGKRLVRFKRAEIRQWLATHAVPTGKELT